MAYTLKTVLRGNYIYISAAGKQTFESNLNLASFCVEECGKHNKRLVLIDLRGLTGQPGTLADYELAKLITSWEAAKNITRTALLEKEEDLPYGKFFETAARNRGINVMVFSDEKKAEEWIETK